MMNNSLLDTSWIWHPKWVDHAPDSAGAFVHFSKHFSLSDEPLRPVVLQVTADTKYRLYINGQLVQVGPVKGDDRLWFYDEIDIAPFLRAGENSIAIHVLRLYHGTPYGTSFPRMPFPGLFVRVPDADDRERFPVQSDSSWQTALDPCRKLRIDQEEDDFLHIYEIIGDDATGCLPLEWCNARCLDLPKTHGIGPPWMLSPRMIPPPKSTTVTLMAIHNVQSSQPQEAWENVLLLGTNGKAGGLRLPAGSSHYLELEAEHHLTAFLRFRFQRPEKGGSQIRIRYSECYEDVPKFVPYVRCKENRCDRSKSLFGPEDKYTFAGNSGLDSATALGYTASPLSQETFSPFHFRTFRFLSLYVQVDDASDLIIDGVDIDMTHYPLEVSGEVYTPRPLYGDLWNISVRTLINCMHDCYEDCPFYEQLQYAMDVRSSCLFTYYVSGDDRMARQAITQLHSSYRADLGLTASRSPASQLQIIPHFSLFWILTVVDHFEHYGDGDFTRQFLPACHGILEAFSRRIDLESGLIRSETPFWDFVDWTNEWKPMGIPPAAQESKYQTFTNMLYAHTIQRLVQILGAVGRPGLADELQIRANTVIEAVRKHCRIGEVYADGLAVAADCSRDLSQHGQIWAVLCGAVSGDEASHLLRACLPVFCAENTSASEALIDSDGNAILASTFTKPSQAMSFYVLRALSIAGGTLYDEAFHNMWQPWKEQLAQNLTTWCEDEVTRRSDCHAWNCAPLYELMAEVAGVRPAEPGWSSVSFKPRTQLFEDFRATVPLMGKLSPGRAYVSWKTVESSGLVEVSLWLDTKVATNEVSIYVTFPDGHQEVHTGPRLTLKF